MSEVDLTPRSRRALLAGALGAAAASVASALGRPAPARAGTGDVMYVGKANNQADQPTGVLATSTVAFNVEGPFTAITATGSTRGVLGITTGASGNAVRGDSNATTGAGLGVFGTSKGPQGAGVRGYSTANSAGVVGVSMGPSGIGPAAAAKTGVHGFAAQADGRGVFGYAISGIGVAGTSDTGTAVRGYASNGYGVRGETSTGTGVHAAAPVGATALSVSGRAVFSRSGRASVPANKRYVDITPAGGLAPTTLVVATMETYRADCFVQIARKNYPTAGTVRIYLNKIASTTTSTTVGWVAIN